jgi:hypothetical protein
MKKVLMVLLAFSLVFGLALTACGNSSGIADLAAEVEAMRTWAPTPEEPPEFDKIGLLVTTVNSWAGLDIIALPYLTIGDTIEMEGKYLTDDEGQVLLNLQHSGELDPPEGYTSKGWVPLAKWNPAPGVGKEFKLETADKKTVALTKADLDAILANEGGDAPYNIRIRTNKLNAKFVITKLTIKRGEDNTLLDLVAEITKLGKGDITEAQVKAIETKKDFKMLTPAGGVPGNVALTVVGP